MVANITFSWDDYLAEIGKPSLWTRQLSDQRGAWSGTRTYEGALDLARHGWAEGRDKIARGLSVVSPATARHSSRFMDVAGAYPIAAMAAAGDMQSMVAMGETETPRAIVKLVCSIGANANVSTDAIINRGIALCGIVDAIEASGQRVELVSGMTASNGYTEAKPYLFSVMVKEAGEPLEIDRVAFAFAHPSSLRRCGFRLIERHHKERDWYSHYGRARDLDPADYGDAIIFQTIKFSDDYSTPERAMNLVRQHVRASGIEID
jgi:hypothetical protein